MGAPVVVLAGGTGGAKLARGMLDVAGEDLVVLANTADDIEIYGAYVAPDPDLVLFWLADRIDERGWGLAGDTFAAMDQLRELGVDVWFNVGDRDLAIGLRRAQRLAEGATLTEAIDELRLAFGVPARVLPMTDAPVRTRVLSDSHWTPFQEFMIRGRGAGGTVEGLELEGIEAATATPDALAALEQARAIVIGPSNPVISIGPILRTPGVADALRAASAPVVAVSPIVGGKALKGPTEPFMSWAGHAFNAIGIADAYGDLIDALVTDEDVETARIRIHRTDTLMRDDDGRRRLAEETLRCAEALA